MKRIVIALAAVILLIPQTHFASDEIEVESIQQTVTEENIEDVRKFLTKEYKRVFPTLDVSISIRHKPGDVLKSVEEEHPNGETYIFIEWNYDVFYLDGIHMHCSKPEPMHMDLYCVQREQLVAVTISDAPTLSSDSPQ